jgi:hypothetical protein
MSLVPDPFNRVFGQSKQKRRAAQQMAAPFEHGQA